MHLRSQYPIPCAARGFPVLGLQNRRFCSVPRFCRYIRNARTGQSSLSVFVHLFAVLIAGIWIVRDSWSHCWFFAVNAWSSTISTNWYSFPNLMWSSSVVYVVILTLSLLMSEPSRRVFSSVCSVMPLLRAVQTGL